MNRWIQAAACAAVLSAATRLPAHGFRVELDANNKLQLTSEDSTAAGRLLYKQDALLGPIFSRSHDHPGFEVESGQLGIDAGSKFRFDALGPLWFADAVGVPQLAPEGVTMLISPQDPANSDDVEIRRGSGFQRGFLIGRYDGTALGDYEHQLEYELDVPVSPTFPDGLPVGAYAIVLRLTGENAAGQPFRPSDPFVTVFNNKLPIASFSGIAEHLFAAAVPEPASCLLAAVGLLGGALVVCRRR